MNKTYRTRIVNFVLGLALILAITACSSAQAASNSAGTAPTAATTASTTAAPATGASTAQAASTFAKLNLNTTSAQDFLTIPGLPSRMVKEFQEYAPYSSILVFRKEIGKYVSADQVAGYEKYVYVPVSPNDSDAATLQQLPGVDATLAAALIAGRPYASNDAFLAKLAPSISADQLAIAKTYLISQ